MRTVLVLLACVAWLPLVGCKAGEAKGGGFVDKSDMYRDTSVPFQRYWAKPGFDKSRYDKLYVAPVNTAHMLSLTEWQAGERKGEIEKDIANLATYTRETIEKAFREDPRHRVTVVDESASTQPGTLILEVALIELVPSKVTLNALGFTPFYIGTAISAVRALASDVSSVAIEARMRDGATGETVVKFADREQQQASPVSVRGLTWYSDAESIIKTWADQFVALANRKPGEVVKDSEPFTLKPW